MTKKVGRPKKENKKKRVLITIDSDLHEFYLNNSDNFSGFVEMLLKQNRTEVYK